MNRKTHLLLSLLMMFGGSACSSLNPLNFIGSSSASLEDAAAVISAAEQAIVRGDYEQALGDLEELFYLEGLPTSLRTRAVQLFAAAAEEEIKRLSQSTDGAEELADFVNDELPREVAVSAGIASARAYIARGEAEEGWKVLRRLDERFPLHHERAAAGRLLVDSGISLSRDDRTWWVFWSAREEGMACLEYVVLNHPAEPRCDEAYTRLGELYSEDNQRLLAIERYSDLVLYHPLSRLRAAAQAQIPMLRLELLNSPEYDRNGLILALAELDDWVIRFPNHTMKDKVLESRLDCLRRLSASDLGIARFYERIGNTEGRLYHAERARELAQVAGDAPLAEAASVLMVEQEPVDS
jgi:outer membrane protein assembly factor BamD (BamD/ComL family)